MHLALGKKTKLGNISNHADAAGPAPEVHQRVRAPSRDLLLGHDESRVEDMSCTARRAEETWGHREGEGEGNSPMIGIECRP